MFDVPDDTETRDDGAVSRREAAPEVDTAAGTGVHEDTDETTLEEAGYGYGV
jgi:hypothetical protein